MADQLEAMWQDMEQEAADELVRRAPHAHRALMESVPSRQSA
jgi:outer membrane lipopolysaccharide assembly protein LptE/RlpB